MHTDEGWLYLATVMDLFNRKIVGWSMGTRLVTSLIEGALIMAIHRNNPPNGVIHHSDRGSQYAVMLINRFSKTWFYLLHEWLG
ncbi:DDE-type integrase/transposase/recombinase [Legionella clemsonensis]|uniref:DDE-type integrase/transposase/recombinase n=1 Tax=Legionella clemsonensis TaxID=1867846 RepID=UPI001E414127|nr:DDE-type integrase/transposase/recombinase [Legionella clemsonensis]